MRCNLPKKNREDFLFIQAKRTGEAIGAKGRDIAFLQLSEKKKMQQ